MTPFGVPVVGTTKFQQPNLVQQPLAAGTTDVSVNVDGNLITASVGSVSITADASVSVTGNLITASVGTVSITGSATVNVTGNVITISVGDVTVTTEDGPSAVWKPYWGLPMSRIR